MKQKSTKEVRIIDYVFTCNLSDNKDIIEKYKHLHSPDGVWPEVTKTFEATGAKSVKIYIQHTRLVLIISLPESVSFDEFGKIYDSTSPKIKEWDQIMSAFQVPPPGAPEGTKWVNMEEMYSFENPD
jgi:L-rhamnose mutarotase